MSSVAGDQPPYSRLDGNSKPPWLFCRPSLLGNQAPVSGDQRSPLKADLRQLARALGLASWACFFK
eukprot:15000796-Heterocapsa_arctica.AAC.1